MDKKIIKVNLDLLKQLINKHSVDVRVFGYAPYFQKAINAATLFEEIHTVAECDREEFTNYVDRLSAENFSRDWDVYERIPEIDILFENVKFPGTFKIVGYEALGNNPYILHKNIKDIIKLCS